MKRALLLVLLVACGDATETAATQLNIDRPVDMSFACFGSLRITNGGSGSSGDTVVQSAMPTSACDVRSGFHNASDPQPSPPGQQDINGQAQMLVSWYGFVLQSEPGTVAIARWDTKPASAFAGGDVSILDADPLTPGENGITVGEDPVAMATSKDGCYVVTANAGSCDLSSLDIGTALDGQPGARVDRLEITNASGVPIHARATAMVAEPSALSTTVGATCPMQATGLMYIAFPSCHLVAGVDISTAQIVTGISYASGTPQLVDGNVTCPDECAGDPPTPGIRPVAVDLFDDTRVGTRRMAIGADNYDGITVVELDTTTSLPKSLSTQILEDPAGTLGVTSVSVTPQIGMGGVSGTINDDTAPGGQMQFVYAVASDHSVRVIEILNVNKECDTEVDPRLIHDVTNVKALSCFPVGDPATPRRRPGLTTPGITLPGTKAIPVSVATFKVDTFPGDPRMVLTDTTVDTLIGYFAIVTSAQGPSFIVNIDDDNYADAIVPSEPLAVQIPLAIAHQVRDGLPGRDFIDTSSLEVGGMPICDSDGPDPDAAAGNEGGARSPTRPAQGLPPGTISAAKSGQLPFFRQVLCTGTDEPTGVATTELEFNAPVDVRDLEFPDLRALREDETWMLTYQGALSQSTSSSDVGGPAIRTSMLTVDNSGTLSLVDQTGPFCDAGVEPFDIVQMRGCDPSLGNTDCPFGYTCFVHPDSQISGLGACMDETEADRLANACKEYLISLRRYSVGHAASGDLVLIPRRHQLLTSPLDGCTDDAQCQQLANYNLQTTSSENPVDDTTPPDTHKYACVSDPSRAPIGGTGNRCDETCTVDTDCDAGTVCQGGFCVEGVIPPQACVNAPQRYDLRASEAFAMVGTLSGYVHSVIADPAGNCIQDPKAHPFQQARVPLIAPTCDPTADARTGKKPDGTYDANPCELTVAQTELEPQFTPGTCNSTSNILAGGPSAPPRQADAIRLHGPGMTLTIVDPTYTGDVACIGDRLGTLQHVPIVPDGYQLVFRQTAGYEGQFLAINPAYPIKVLRGPTESIWVMDEGDFLSGDPSVASTEGKVFRIETIALTIVNIVQ